MMAPKLFAMSPRILSIFIDETGEYGFSKGSAAMYGVSLVLHDQNYPIATQIDKLTFAYSTLGFTKMVHMGDLAGGRGDYTEMKIEDRKKIFVPLYRFAVTVPASYHTIVFKKKHYNSADALSDAIEKELLAFIVDNLTYLQSFDQIVVYYDGGQKELDKVITRTFGKLTGYERRSTFDHTDKKLFQVADMLTFVDRLIYKYKNNIQFSETEKALFSIREIKKMQKDLQKKRL